MFINDTSRQDRKKEFFVKKVERSSKWSKERGKESPEQVGSYY